MGPAQLLAQFVRLVEKGRVLIFLAGGVTAWGVVTNLPAIWGFLKEVKEFLVQVAHSIDLLKKDKDFEDAITLAREHGDTSSLEKLFGGTGAPIQGGPDPFPHL